MGEYSHRDGQPDINDECWTNPRRTWRSRQFIANVYVGNSLGILNYSVRFMQTVDDMDANGFYTGREEFVVAFVALRYPNSLFSIPWFPLPRRLDYRWQFPGKLVFSRIGGPGSVPPIFDPISTLYVRGRFPSRPPLYPGGIYHATFEDLREWEVRHGLTKPEEGRAVLPRAVKAVQAVQAVRENQQYQQNQPDGNVVVDVKVDIKINLG